MVPTGRRWRETGAGLPGKSLQERNLPKALSTTEFPDAIRAKQGLAWLIGRLMTVHDSSRHPFTGMPRPLDSV